MKCYLTRDFDGTYKLWRNDSYLRLSCGTDWVGGTDKSDFLVAPPDYIIDACGVAMECQSGPRLVELSFMDTTP